MAHQTSIKNRHLRAIACAVALTVAMPGPKASGETANTTPSKTPPSYIEADRSDADQVLGPALTDNVFSDRFTALRKQLVATSLRHVLAIAKGRDRLVHRSIALAPPLTENPIC